MHTGGIYGDYLEQSKYYGWKTEKSDFKFDWDILKDNVRK